MNAKMVFCAQKFFHFSVGNFLKIVINVSYPKWGLQTVTSFNHIQKGVKDVWFSSRNWLAFSKSKHNKGNEQQSRFIHHVSFPLLSSEISCVKVNLAQQVLFLAVKIPVFGPCHVYVPNYFEMQGQINIELRSEWNGLELHHIDMYKLI